MLQAQLHLLKAAGIFIKDLFLPPVCLHCGVILENNSDNDFLCHSCFQKLKTISPNYVKTDIHDRLSPCFIDSMFVAYEFSNVLRSVIHSVKYQKMPQLGFHLGKLSVTILKKYLEEKTEKNFVPVPLHVVRRKEREFNQSSFISEGIFAILGGSVFTDLVKRVRYTQSQTKLNREERQSNVQDAFIVNRNKKLPSKIILVDDLITTGATLNECARIFKENGVEEIIGLGVASPV
jgi:ComF family protein